MVSKYSPPLTWQLAIPTKGIVIMSSCYRAKTRKKLPMVIKSLLIAGWKTIPRFSLPKFPIVNLSTAAFAPTRSKELAALPLVLFGLAVFHRSAGPAGDAFGASEAHLPDGSLRHACRRPNKKRVSYDYPCPNRRKELPYFLALGRTQFEPLAIFSPPNFLVSTGGSTDSLSPSWVVMIIIWLVALCT